MAEYIEREAAIRNIRKMASMIGFENPAVAIDCAVKCLERVPAADVAPVVHGRWTFYSSYGEDEYEYECSVCNEWANQRYTYCPNCGAHMKDGE